MDRRWGTPILGWEQQAVLEALSLSQRQHPTPEQKGGERKSETQMDGEIRHGLRHLPTSAIWVQDLATMSLAPREPPGVISGHEPRGPISTVSWAPSKHKTKQKQKSCDPGSQRRQQRTVVLVAQVNMRYCVSVVLVVVMAVLLPLCWEQEMNTHISLLRIE